MVIKFLAIDLLLEGVHRQFQLGTTAASKDEGKRALSARINSQQK